MEEVKPGTKHHVCTHCSFKASCDFLLKRHISYHEKGLSLIECPSCDYKTFNKIKFRSHKIVHFDETKYKCNMCAYITISQKLLNRHIHKQHRAKDFNKIFLSDTESQLFNYSESSQNNTAFLNSSVASHQSTTAPGAEEGVKKENVSIFAPDPCLECTVCRYSFSSKVELRKHIRNEHQSFLCDICGNGYTRLSSLNKHRVFKHREGDVSENLNLMPSSFHCSNEEHSFITSDSSSQNNHCFIDPSSASQSLVVDPFASSDNFGIVASTS